MVYTLEILHSYLHIEKEIDMPRFNKRFYKKQILKTYGDNKASRKIMMVIDLNMSDKDRYSWNEFVSIFQFIS